MLLATPNDKLDAVALKIKLLFFGDIRADGTVGMGLYVVMKCIAVFAPCETQDSTFASVALISRSNRGMVSISRCG